ncbi:MAG: hypothetical protein L3J29_10300 [Cyclobacteriaceae bacterium]|nr:hypothetical protein [Cyclobacteriaceae bacterium]
MKKLLILLAVAAVSCTGSEKKPEVIEKVVTKVVRDTVTVEKVVIEKESNQLQNDNVRSSFLNMVDAINNASPENVENLIAFLDKEYAFKGQDQAENVKRLTKLFTKFKFNITDVEIKSIKSSCDLAYLVVGFKKSIIGRESGVESVKDRDKVGLFIMKKNAGDQWKLLVQKTDDGFAHWFYTPE